MARYMQDYMILEAPEKTWPIIQQYFAGKGFTYKEYHGEMVFQKGNGWLLAPTFAKVSYYTDRVRVEAWISGAILPYVFVGEYGIEGFYGCAAKGKMKEAALMFDQVLGGPAARIGCNAWLQKNGPAMPAPQPALYGAPVAQNGAYCAQCGAANTPGSAYCYHCGNPL